MIQIENTISFRCTRYHLNMSFSFWVLLYNTLLYLYHIEEYQYEKQNRDDSSWICWDWLFGRDNIDCCFSQLDFSIGEVLLFSLVSLVSLGSWPDGVLCSERGVTNPFFNAFPLAEGWRGWHRFNRERNIPSPQFYNELEISFCEQIPAKSQIL